VTVALSNLDRVLWPEAGFTKGAMLDYYRRVAPVLLPHLAGRHLTLWRFPEGVHRQGFWQNECRGAPPWLRTAAIRGQRFCVVDDLRSLVWLANLGTVELHPFLSLADEPDRPTALVFDLDPGPPADVLDCAAVALRLRERLPPAYVKTSGSLGLHVVPLAPGHGFDETKAFARAVAEALAAERPDEVVATARREARRGKVLVDWLQNDATRSTVAPYSLRATPWPTVSTPLEWAELEDALAARRPELLTFTPELVFERLERLGDLHAAVADVDAGAPPGTLRP
jgi:bifunctional non-homologous end joining protein LigD